MGDAALFGSIFSRVSKRDGVLFFLSLSFQKLLRTVTAWHLTILVAVGCEKILESMCPITILSQVDLESFSFNLRDVLAFLISREHVRMFLQSISISLVELFYLVILRIKIMMCIVGDVSRSIEDNSKDNTIYFGNISIFELEVIVPNGFENCLV